MSLKTVLSERKAAIVNTWFDQVVGDYPPDSAAIFKRQKDPFANPVGHIARESLGGLVDQLLGDMDAAALRGFLDPIIRVRAVQSFTPSQAVSFIYSLRRIFRESLGERGGAEADWSALDRDVDRLALLAFDLYMECREHLFQLRTDDIHIRAVKTLRRAGLIADEPGGEGPPA